MSAIRDGSVDATMALQIGTVDGHARTSTIPSLVRRLAGTVMVSCIYLRCVRWRWTDRALTRHGGHFPSRREHPGCSWVPKKNPHGMGSEKGDMKIGRKDRVSANS